MNNNLLIQTLEKFDKKELNQLSIYLKSPFQKVPKQVLACFYFLKNAINKNEVPKKIDLHHSIFGKNTLYQDHKIRLLISDLLKLIENYIGVQVQKEHPVNQQIRLAKFYRKNGLEKHFHRVQKKSS